MKQSIGSFTSYSNDSVMSLRPSTDESLHDDFALGKIWMFEFIFILYEVQSYDYFRVKSITRIYLCTRN